MSEINLTNNEAQHRYEAATEGRLAGFAAGTLRLQVRELVAVLEAGAE